MAAYVAYQPNDFVFDPSVNEQVRLYGVEDLQEIRKYLSNCSPDTWAECTEGVDSELYQALWRCTVTDVPGDRWPWALEDRLIVRLWECDRLERERFQAWSEAFQTA